MASKAPASAAAPATAAPRLVIVDKRAGRQQAPEAKPAPTPAVASSVPQLAQPAPPASQPPVSAAKHVRGDEHRGKHNKVAKVVPEADDGTAPSGHHGRHAHEPHPHGHASGEHPTHGHHASEHHAHGHHASEHHAHGHPSHGTAGSGISEAFLSDKLWTDADIAPLLSAPTKRALADAFGFHRMSKVQAASLAMLMRGDDCFAKAKTGGGKTLAFLLPAVERLVALGAARQPGTVGILVVSPTRELALQILEEARTLVRFQAPPLHVEAVIGGTNISSERKRLHGPGGKVAVDILVATPGRCVDHIDSTPGFAAALQGVRVLVLDEADRLLDMGFEASLNQISRALPPGAPPPAGTGPRPPGRQSLLFSATVPEPVKAVAHRFLRAGYPLIDTVGANETATNPQVTQEAIVLPAASVVPALAVVLGHIATTNPRHKTVVFFTTARMTGYMASVFERLTFRSARGDVRLNVIEMHSRKSQGYRTSASEKFRAGSGMVMFSSDVSARGMDYPGITEVIQVGLTDREQYIHRLGRTARAGREGAGLLLLADFEARALLQELHDLPISPAGPASDISGGVAAGLPPYGTGVPLGPARSRADFLSRFPVSAPVAAPATLSAALARVAQSEEDLREASQAYGAMLGFYNSAQRRLGWSAEAMVAEMNALFLTLGCPDVPIMPRDTLGKMGLRGVAGIREGPSLRGQGGRGGGGHGDGQGGGHGGGGSGSARSRGGSAGRGGGHRG